MDRKAAALLESMVGHHGFIDGNKRAAWPVVEVLIERSGYVWDMPDDEPIDDIVVGVAEGAISFDDLSNWFKVRLIRTVL